MSGIKKREEGFSLVEIMIVISILVVVLAITIPPLMRFYRTYKFNSYVASVGSLMKRGRLLSMESGNNTAICWDGATRTLKLVDAGTKRSGFCSGMVVEALRIEDNFIEVTFSSGIFDGLGFDPRGLAINSGSVQLRNTTTGTCVKYTTQALRGAIIKEGC